MPTHELSAPQQQADNSSNIYNDQKELKASKKLQKAQTPWVQWRSRTSHAVQAKIDNPRRVHFS